MHIHEDWNIDFIILYNLYRSTRKKSWSFIYPPGVTRFMSYKRNIKIWHGELCNSAKSAKCSDVTWALRPRRDQKNRARTPYIKFDFKKMVSELWPDWEFRWHLNQQFTLPLFKIGCHVIFCLSSVLDRRPSIEMNFLGIFMVLENHFWSDRNIITSFYENIT